MREIAYREAIRDALQEEMERDERVFLMGEDVGAYGGAYAATRGLLDRFGPKRVVDTPISEAGFVGLGVGAAITGLRPVVELMFVDFLGVAMDQVASQMAKLRYMTGGKLMIPMVLRMQGGTGRSAGAQHSQSLEAWVAHIPGLRVVMPATPADAKGLLKTAIRSNDPVVYIEHKALYTMKGPVPDGDITLPFGKCAIVREGGDLTIVTYSRMVHYAVEAATRLSEEAGIEATVLDLRTLNPLDTETVVESVRQTGLALVVSEAHRFVGVGAELSSIIHENCFASLRAPVARVAGKDVPVPAGRLEPLAIPSVDEIFSGAMRLAGAAGGSK